MEGKITRKEKKFIVQLCGDEECVIAMLRLIWEISFLYEGYFYSPDRYWVDGSLKNVNDLYFLSYYKSGKIWRGSSLCLATEKMDYSKELILKYKKMRNTGRESGVLYKTLINSFFYLHSEAYDGINVNHRLSLLLNACDGIGINFKGQNNNVGANIANTIRDTLDANLVKYGASLLGIPKSKVFDALKAERDEIDHYIAKKGSLSDYLTNRTDIKSDYVNWYFIFVLELAIRLSLLEEIGGGCSDICKVTAIQEINDWIILGSDMDEECKNPQNVMKQKFQKQGVFIR